MLQTFRLDTSGPFRHLITVMLAICVRFYDEFMHMQTWLLRDSFDISAIWRQYFGVWRRETCRGVKIKIQSAWMFSCIYSSKSPQGGKFLIRFSDNFNHAYLNFWSRFRLIVISETRWSPLCASCCQNMQTVKKIVCFFWPATTFFQLHCNETRMKK